MARVRRHYQLVLPPRLARDEAATPLRARCRRVDSGCGLRFDTLTSTSSLTHRSSSLSDVFHLLLPGLSIGSCVWTGTSIGRPTGSEGLLVKSYQTHLGDSKIAFKEYFADLITKLDVFELHEYVAGVDLDATLQGNDYLVIATKSGAEGSAICVKTSCLNPQTIKVNDEMKALIQDDKRLNVWGDERQRFFLFFTHVAFFVGISVGLSLHAWNQRVPFALAAEAVVAKCFQHL